MPLRRALALPLFLLVLALTTAAHAEDGYRLWLRYEPVTEKTLHSAYTQALSKVVLATPNISPSPTLAVAQAELVAGLRGLLGREVAVEFAQSTESVIGGDDAFAIRLAQG